MSASRRCKARSTTAPCSRSAAPKRCGSFADPEMPWTLDGEKEDGHETVEVENLHHAIRLMQKKDEDA